MIKRPRDILTGRFARRYLRPAGVVLIALVLAGGIPLEIAVRHRLHQVKRATEISAILRTFRDRLQEVHEGCELPAGTEVPAGLLARLNQRADLEAAAGRMISLFRDEPSASEDLARTLADLDRAFDSGRTCLLLKIEARLARSGGNDRRAEEIETRAEPARRDLNNRLAGALVGLSRIEERNQKSFGRAVTALGLADIIALATVGLIALLLWYLWDTRRRREKHLQGARLVEDMLEAYSRRLEAMNAELEQVNLLKTQILSNTSHELLTPLNGIMGSLEVVRSGSCTSPTEEHEFIEQAYTSADHLFALIRDLLDLCRLEEGDFALHPREMEFGPLLDRVLGRHKNAVAARGLALLVISPAEGWPRVRADSSRLDQVLQHLLSNAIKFTEAGSIRITGRADDNNGSFLRVEVADTGVGIEQEKLPRVFDLFLQADSSNTRRFGGTGLGLTLSRHLIQGMGGEIGIESEGPGRGTRVFFSLPLAAAAGSPSPDRHPAQDASSPEEGQRRAA